MDDNFNNDQEQFKNTGPTQDTATPDVNDNNINNFKMDDRGNVHRDKSGGMVVTATSSRTFLIIGWVSAALAAFVSPWFAIAGIVFGVLANRQARGSGTAVIITNVVLAAINLIFGFVIIMTIRRMLIGY